MKTQKLLVIVASVCMLAVFITGSAYALDDNLDQIIADYLAEFQQNTDETLEDFDRIARDLRECYNEFDRCQDPGDEGAELLKCLGEFIPCAASQGRDKNRTCTQYLREFRGDYRRANRDARQISAEEEFQQDPAVQNTVVVAQGVSSLCY